MEWTEMTDAQKRLRVIELEDGIETAHQLIYFLYQCLEKPAEAKHMFPHRTMDTIKNLQNLYSAPFCFHSSTEVACPSCMERYERNALIIRLRTEEE